MVKTKVFLEDTSLLSRDKGLLVDGEGRAVDLHVHKFIGGDVALVKFAAASDRDAAAAMRGREVFIPRDALPSLAYDEFYYQDIVGMQVFDADNVFYGSIEQVANFGAGDVVDIVLADGKNRVMLPITKSFFIDINTDTARATIKRPVFV